MAESNSAMASGDAAARLRHGGFPQEPGQNLDAGTIEGRSGVPEIIDALTVRA